MDCQVNIDVSHYTKSSFSENYAARISDDILGLKVTNPQEVTRQGMDLLKNWPSKLLSTIVAWWHNHKICPRAPVAMATSCANPLWTRVYQEKHINEV